MSNFNKKRADEALEALIDMGKRLSKPKLREFYGHINEIAVFIEAAKYHARHDRQVLRAACRDVASRQ